MAGFEQNQQDAFNQRNDANSLKQLEATLDKATAAIGEAELAAEKELAELKLKNLEIQQNAKLKKLDELLRLEEAGIQSLANARLTLSDKQFEARKNQIEEEFKLSKKAVEDLRKIASKQFEVPVNRPSVAPKNKSGAQANTPSAAKAATETNAELLGLVGSIDSTLGSLRDTVATFAQAKEKGLLAGTNEQTSQQPVTSSIKTTQTVANTAATSIPTDIREQPNTDSTTGSVNSGVSADAASSNVPNQTSQQQYSDGGMDHRDTVDLGSHSFKSILEGFDTLKTYLAGKGQEQTKIDLESILRSEGTDKPAPQVSLDIAGELLKGIKAANDAEARLQAVRASADADAATQEAVILNQRLLAATAEHDLRKKYAAEEDKAIRDAASTEAALAYTRANRDTLIALEEQKLKQGHADATLKAMLTNIAITAKKNDLEHNRRVYAHEEYRALSLNFLAEQNKLTEEQIKAEAKLKFVNANKDRLQEQEAHKLRKAHTETASNAELARIAATAKAEDLRSNRADYLQEAFWSKQNAFADEQNKIQQALIDAEATRDFQKAPANANQLADLESDKLRLAHINAEGEALKALRAADARASDLEHNRELYFQEEKWTLEQAYINTQNKLIEERIKTEAALAYTGANRAELIEQAEHKLKNEHASANLKIMQANIAAVAQANDLEHNRRLYAEEEYRSLRIAYAEEQNKLTKDQIKAEAKRKFVNANKDKLRDQEAHKLRTVHTNAETAAVQDMIAATAKAEDLKNNRGLYLQEAFWKQQQAFADEQNRLEQEQINAEAALAFQKDPGNASQLMDQEAHKLRIAHINTEGDAIKARRASDAKAADLVQNKELYFQEEKWALEKAYVDTQNKLIVDRIKTEAALAYTGANRDKLIAQEEQKLNNEHAAASLKAMQANIAAVAKADDLEHNRKLYAEEEYRALRVAFQEGQNKLATEEIQAEAKLKFVNANKAKLLDQAAHKLRIGHINAEHDAMQALIDAQAKKDDLKNNRDQYLKESKQKLEVGHVNKQNDLEQAGIDIEAKAADLTDNKDQYILEARMARENAFYEERNRQAEELIQLETELAWDKAHSEEIIAQELQKKRLGYLKEYQGHQQKAGKYAVDQAKFERDRAKKANDAAKKEAVNGMVDGLKKFGTGEFSMTDVKQAYGEYMGQRTAELKESGMDDASAELTAQFELLAEAAGSLAKTLDAKVKEISAVQGIVDTRLQGSQTNERDFGNGSYWNQLLEDAKKIAGASPFIKQEKLVDNMKALVEKGISFDIKQRAFLMTIQEKIANTFNVADGTLLRLIRIQQEDTTAGRLGMESALNSFLNSMYETSEYLENVAANVRSSLEEMQALMDGAAATEVEYQVQKWMGSLYSVGMSDKAVQDIANTFGQLASGDVSGLTGSGTGNLLIMAANEAGKSVADILQKGLDASETDELMEAMVNYLAEIAETSSDSKVVQQQLANVYGVKASDLRAATNLATSVKDVSKNDLSYDGMLGQLESMMNTIRFRTSIGEGLTNMWDNVMYSMASTQASNPILYLLPKMANLLKDVTGGEGGGGIALPFLNVSGFGVDLNTTVSDLMLVASMAGTALGALGPAITGLADLANPLVGSSMLRRAGIDTKSGKVPVLARGTGVSFQNVSGASTSESGLVGNSSGDDIKNATMQDAEDSKKKQMVEAKDEETADDIAMEADLAVVKIYNLLEEVAHGSQSLRVKVISGGCNCSHTHLYGDGGGSFSGNNSGGGVGNGTTTPSGAVSSDNGNWVLTI